MKAFKALVLAKSIAAAAFAAAGIAAPAVSHASPDDGMVCRSGYGAQFASGNMKCSRALTKFVSLECTNASFPSKVIRTRTRSSSHSSTMSCESSRRIDWGANRRARPCRPLRSCMRRTCAS